MLTDSARRPDLLRRAGISLTKLDDAEGQELLLQVLQNATNNQPALEAAAQALGFRSDAKRAQQLSALLVDRKVNAHSRARLADALGRVADKDWLPWHALFTINANYRATTPTLAVGIFDKS